MKRLFVIASVAALAGLLLAAPAASAAVYTQDQCLVCHMNYTPGIVAQFEQGVMSQPGNDVTCIDCHGNDHSAIWASDGKVPPSRCDVCHSRQYAEFTVKDAGNNYVNKHAIGWTRMTAAARYLVMPAPERYEMCERCHNVGYVYQDGSIGKCDSCHTRHVFSKEEALEPVACGTCHMGPDHEQIDMWEKSKHGVVYATEKDRPGGNPGRAPTCVTCHMPDQENGAGQPLTHNVSTNITIGTVAQGAEVGDPASPPKTSVPMRTISQADFDARRAKMESICSRCHAGAFATKNLQGADAIKLDVDNLLWDPVMRIRGLWYDGLLDPMPASRPPNPVFGANLVLGGQQLYGGTSAIEQWFFYTYKYDHVNTFKGAYHINPDYSHWYGWSEVNQDRDIIKGEEASLRRGSAPGFGVSTSRATVGQSVTFDASALTEWGNATANTFEWWFGDGQSSLATLGDAVKTHIYLAPGKCQVQLTVSDSDAVNDAANPLLCSGKRTTSVTVRVKYSATLSMASIARVRAGKQVSVKVTFTTGDAQTGAALQLWSKVGSGGWTKAGTKTVTTAGAPVTVTFKPTLKKKTSYKVTWAGDRDTWNATSNVRTVTPK